MMGTLLAYHSVRPFAVLARAACGWGRTVYDIYVSADKDGIELYRTSTVRWIQWRHSLSGHDGFESQQLSRQQSRESSTSVIPRGLKTPLQPTQVLVENKNALCRAEPKLSVFFVDTGKIVDRKGNLQFRSKQMNTCGEKSR